MISFCKEREARFENSGMQNSENPVLSQSYRLLGTALFTYMLIFVLMITLAPFSYHIPERLAVFWFWELKEMLQNVFLFVPFGFLLHSVINPSRKGYLHKVFWASLGLSTFIEFNQFYIYTRMTSLYDIFANTGGGVIGALFYNLIREKLNQLSGKMVLDMPLTNLLFLLVPLLWLSSLAIGNQLQRIWLLLPLGLIGLIIVADLFTNRIHPSWINRLFTLLFYEAWFLSGAFPALIEYPKIVALMAFVCGIVLGVILLLYTPPKNGEQRFELSALKKIVPLYALYLIVLNRWPMRSFTFDYNFTFVPEGLFTNSDLDDIIRMIQLFSSFTIVGYVMYQYINRKHPRNSLLKLVFFLLVAAVFIEMPRGFNPSQQATLTYIFFDFFWGLFGSLIYILQLHYYKAIKNSNLEEKLKLDFDSKTVQHYRPKS